MKFSIVASTVVALLASSAMAAPQRRVGGRKTITKVVVTTKTSTTFIDVTAAPTPAPEPSSSEVVPAPAPTSSSVFTPAPEPTTSSSAFTPPPAPTTSSTVIIVPTPTPTPTTTRTTATPAPAPTSSSTTVAAPAPTASSSGSFEDIVLSIHNQLRARHSAPALSWDSNLASQAASNSARCVFEHSGLGPENLVSASQRTDKGETLPQLYEREMMMWYNEVSQYDFNAGVFSSGTGHFTQMVWKSATKMGCGIATNCGSSLPNYITCRYDEGNMQGAFKENVLPAQ